MINMVKNLEYVQISDFGDIRTGKTPKTENTEYWNGYDDNDNRIYFRDNRGFEWNKKFDKSPAFFASSTVLSSLHCFVFAKTLLHIGTGPSIEVSSETSSKVFLSNERYIILKFFPF